MALLPPYYNRELFSKRLPEQLLPQRPEWQPSRYDDLTEEEIALMRRTAPPRDPLTLITGTAPPSAES